MRERWPKARRSSTPNQRWLRSCSGVFFNFRHPPQGGCPPAYRRMVSNSQAGGIFSRCREWRATHGTDAAGSHYPRTYRNGRGRRLRISNEDVLKSRLDRIKFQIRLKQSMPHYFCSAYDLLPRSSSNILVMTLFPYSDMWISVSHIRSSISMSRFVTSSIISKYFTPILSRYSLSSL